MAISKVVQDSLNGGVAGTGPAFSAYLGGNQSATNNIWVKVALGTEIFDTNNCFDNTTNYRFTPNVAGYYKFDGVAASTAPNGSSGLMFYKNGSQTQYMAPNYGNGLGFNNACYIQYLTYMNGTTDYVELYYIVSGSNATIQGTSTPIQVYATGFMVRAA